MTNNTKHKGYVAVLRLVKIIVFYNVALLNYVKWTSVVCYVMPRSSLRTDAKIYKEFPVDHISRFFFISPNFYAAFISNGFL